MVKYWHTYFVVSLSSNCYEGWKYNHPRLSAPDSSEWLQWTLWRTAPLRNTAPSGSQSASSVCNLLTCMKIGLGVGEMSYDPTRHQDDRPGTACLCWRDSWLIMAHRWATSYRGLSEAQRDNMERDQTHAACNLVNTEEVCDCGSIKMFFWNQSQAKMCQAQVMRSNFGLIILVFRTRITLTAWSWGCRGGCWPWSD